MRRIRLYGGLAKFLGRRQFKADVANAAEAVRFLVANFPELEGHMADRYYKVKVGDREVGTDELHYPSGQREEIKIIPVLAGAGSNGLGIGQIILGIALIAVSIAVPAATFGLTSMLGVGLFGGALALSGIGTLLTPTPTVATGADSQDDPRKSYSFSGIQNTSRQGVPVPIVYGETLVGSVVVSAGIDIDQVVV